MGGEFRSRACNSERAKLLAESRPLWPNLRRSGIGYRIATLFSRPTRDREFENPLTRISGESSCCESLFAA
jgi:hypothetical protein